MKQLTINGQRLLLVSVWGSAFSCAKDDEQNSLVCYNSKQEPVQTIKLHHGNWEFLGFGNTISEDVAAGLVENLGQYQAGFVDYKEDNKRVFTATESLATLLTAHGFQPATTAILTAEK